MTWPATTTGLDWDVPKHRILCHCKNDTDAGICTTSQIDLGRLVLETDSPMLSRASGHPYGVVGHATYVAKYRHLPAWVVLRVAALNAKAFYGV